LNADPIFDLYVANLYPLPSKVIVRSSATDETLDDRGLYESKKCEFSKDSILEAINGMWMAFEGFDQIPGKANSLRMALVIQPLISARVFGHLSNERRVSRRITDWLCEVESTSDTPSRSFKFGVAKSSVSSNPLPSVKDDAELERVLRSIASYSCSGKHRLHYEWVWDGSRIWVVQKDIEIDVAGEPPGNEWNVTVPSNRPHQPRILVEDSQSKGQWGKIKCVMEFRNYLKTALD